ncbi:MAG: 3-deoxy-8-phosphooctulonate synthase, partial [Acidobacteriota bacterium]|nr:3-deoxy-8-phosphooctulonate synthase [Acidobacteriota bacterium]
MSSQRIRIADSIEVGDGAPLLLIAGPDVVESEDHAVRMATALSAIARDREIPLVYKSSFDKANRTSRSSFRGPGLVEGLRILGRVKSETGLAVTTDFHTPDQAAAVAEVADLLQVPAFLCRQTDMLVAAARTGRPVNVKKGQFLAPGDTRHIVEKVTSSGA